MTDNQDREAVSAISAAALKFARFHRALLLTAEIERLSRRSEHFATPRWQRPYWRIRVYFARRKAA